MSIVELSNLLWSSPVKTHCTDVKKIGKTDRQTDRQTDATQLFCPHCYGHITFKRELVFVPTYHTKCSQAAILQNNTM